MRFNNFWCYRRIIFSKNFLRTVWHSRRNVLADRVGEPPPAGPYMAEFDITYQCNCRCRMCQRWKDARPPLLNVDDYRRLAGEFRHMGVHQISVAGGEPLMRSDVFDIMAGFADEGLSVNLCTNGMLLGKYSRQIVASRPTCVTVSLDGASAASHDAIRGVPRSFKCIAAGIDRFLSVPAARRPVLRVRMTISSLNQAEIGAFYRRWHQVADDVLLQPVHHCSDSFYTGMQNAELSLDPDELTSQMRGTTLAADAYMGKYVNSLRSSGTCPDNPCYAGVLMVRIDPWGNVFPCLEQHVKVGSVLGNSFHSVWHSVRFNEERNRLRNGRSCRCWYNNTALIGHYGHLLQKTTVSRMPATKATAIRSGTAATAAGSVIKPSNRE